MYSRASHPDSYSIILYHGNDKDSIYLCDIHKLSRGALGERKFMKSNIFLSPKDNKQNCHFNTSGIFVCYEKDLQLNSKALIVKVLVNVLLEQEIFHNCVSYDWQKF